MAKTITIGDFNSQKENFTVIDVREPDEMAGGKIDGSKNVPLGLVIRNAKKGQMAENTSAGIEFVSAPNLVKKLDINDSVLAVLRYKIK